jgi:hypothetical protein
VFHPLLLTFGHIVEDDCPISGTRLSVEVLSGIESTVDVLELHEPFDIDDL